MMPAPRYPANEMHYSDQGVEFTLHWEGSRNRPYYDSGHVLTVGMGHTGADVHPGDVWTDEQIKKAAIGDIAKAEATVHELLGSTLLDQSQYDALVDFEFNTGALGKSTLLRMVLAGDQAAADAQFLLWDHCKGLVIQGLLSRREAEARLFAE